MVKENKKPNRLAMAMLETAKDMRHAGVPAKRKVFRPTTNGRMPFSARLLSGVKRIA